MKIIDAYPMKAQFLKDENIEIGIEIENNCNEIKDVQLEVDILFLNKKVETQKYDVNLLKNCRRIIKANFSPKNEQFKGYGVDILLIYNGKAINEYSTSFDIVSDYRKALRYGFLSDFSDGDANDEEDIKFMRNCHINIVQFYDWMYRHDDYIPPQAEFKNFAGRALNIDAVREKIKNCHKYNMKTMAYGAVYAASKPYYEKNKQYALCDSSGDPFNLGDTFFIMDISRDSTWHEHIINEYKKAIAEMNFDGIHMDTYGFPKIAISKVNGRNKVLRMENVFPQFINDVRTELGRNTCLIFNNVGNWPVESTAKADQDAVYIEVWKPYERYFHIKSIIDNAKIMCNGKPIILAAYLKPFEDKDNNSIEKAYESFKLLTAVIVSNGAYHLILGEDKGILNGGYYVNYSKIKDDKFLRCIRNYYDFLVRYSNILYDYDMKDVSMTHVDGDNNEYIFEGAQFSAYGEPNKVWTIIREKSGFKAINFINLTGNDEDYWNAGKNEPIPAKDIIAKVIIEEDVKEVFAASPDIEMGRPIKLDYSIEKSKRGKTLIVKMPTLYTWSVLYIEMKNQY